MKVTELNNAAQKNIIGEKEYISGKKCLLVTTVHAKHWSNGVPCGTGIACSPSKD